VWKTFEEQHGTSDDAAKVDAMKPIISKRRRVDQENGQMVEGEFFDDIFIPLVLMNPSCSEHVFVFPDDEKESHPTSFKFLQIAHAWKEAQKKKQAEASSTNISEASEDEDMEDDDGSSRADEDEHSSGHES
jgi:crooked neck